MGDQQTPQKYGFQKFIFCSPYDAVKFIEFNSTVIFEIRQKLADIGVGGSRNLDPLKCRNSGIDAARRNALANRHHDVSLQRKAMIAPPLGDGHHHPTYEF